MARIRMKLADASRENILTIEAEGSGAWVAKMSGIVGGVLELLKVNEVEIEPVDLVRFGVELDEAWASTAQGKNFEGALVRTTITES